MNAAQLTELWRSTHNTKGWMSRLPESLTREEFHFIVDLDDRFVTRTREMELAWRKTRTAYQRPEVDAEWARGRRLEYLNGRISEVKTRLANIRLARGRAVNLKDKDRIWIHGEDFTDAFFVALEAMAVEEAQKLKADAQRVEFPIESKSGISDEMIQRARAVRLGTLLGVDEKKRIKCPFHGEDRHPAGSILKGFFKCFVCGKGPIDSIGWLMEVEGYTFPAAVNRLVGI